MGLSVRDTGTPFLLALLLAAAQGLPAFQGMASATRTPRPAPAVESNLPPVTVDFRDVAVDAGLTAPNVSGGEDRKKYILETTGNGVAIFDFDNDGLMDIFIANGTTLDGKGKGEKSTGRLYRNTGRLRFEDLTEKAGLVRTGWGQGVCAGDYDNDGDRDLFLTYYGQSVLYRNKGDGTFQNVTESAGLSHAGVRWDTGCTFFDYDLDGKLDLAVTGYLEFDQAKVPEPGSGGYCQWKGIPVMCGPRGLPFGHALLFRNAGDGKFRDVSLESGVGAPGGCYGFTAVASDFNNDGYPDLYVACDSTPSLLFHNLKNGSFEEIGVASGASLNEDGQEQAGMGVAVADVDEDGYFDIVKTNFSDDTPNLYRNSGDGAFEDKVYQAGLGVHTEYVGWGVQLIDVDHDGRRDVLMVNGHVYPEVEKIPAMKFRQERLLFRNVGKTRFQDISKEAGPGIAAAWSSRGSAAGDLDNDGSLEVVISNLGDRPSLLKNFGPKKNWLLVACTGVNSNRDAVGARVYVYLKDRRLSSEVQSGTSFLSQHDPRLHFGLGDESHYDRIEVQWPGGARERFPAGKANTIVSLKQGSGTPAAAAGSTQAIRYRSTTLSSTSTPSPGPAGTSR
jgi:hypothetical protein